MEPPHFSMVTALLDSLNVGSKKEDITTSQFVLFLPNVSLSSTILSVANTVYYVPSRKAEIGIERPLWKEEFS